MSAQGIALLKELEGVERKAYRDTAGLWTIGVGHLIKPNETDLLTATLTDEEIENLLRADLAWSEKAVNDNVRVRITQNQFDALVSFVFNVGAGAFEDSTLLRKLNEGAKPRELVFEFGRWNKAGGQVVQGLINRRRKEAGLFLQHLSTLAVVLVMGAALALLVAGYLTATA